MPQTVKLFHKEMPVLPYSQRQALPASPGIYYVGNEVNAVMYVGLARNLRSRHSNHHRQTQFCKIAEATIRYQVLPAVSQGVDLIGTLRKLEKQAIAHYKPLLNNTPVPNEPTVITSHGPVYVQTHKVSDRKYCHHLDCADGDELEIRTSKFAGIVRAVREERPVFLITSGSYQDYQQWGYPNLPELIAYPTERIYLLVSRFIPCGYLSPYGSNKYYSLYGDTSKVFSEPYIILNQQPGFEAFKRQYLSLGFTNCERSPFAAQLMSLGNFRLLSPTSAAE